MCLHLCQPTFDDQQVAIHGGNNSGHLCTRIPASGYSRASGRWRSDVPPSLPLPPHQLAGNARAKEQHGKSKACPLADSCASWQWKQYDIPCEDIQRIQFRQVLFRKRSISTLEKMSD
uniref:Uncharacterized protein n=1 Tax=Triticum urartu TaxID=4572 RepID=A0A8R7VCQ7_TRIUA